MATYTELFGLASNSALRNKIIVACVVAADAIRLEAANTTNHTNRLLWSKAVFANPSTEADRMMYAILATNRALTAAQITGAADTDIQTAVNAVVDLFATGA